MPKAVSWKLLTPIQVYYLPAGGSLLNNKPTIKNQSPLNRQW